MLHLEEILPEGLLASAAWLEERGYSSALRAHYVAAGWLKQPARGVFSRGRGPQRWEQVVISLQRLMRLPPFPGGRTALALQGYAHFLPHEERHVHLYTVERLPGWLDKLPLPARFVPHNADRLFRNDPVTRGLTAVAYDPKSGGAVSSDPWRASLTELPWGDWQWPLTLSTVERAILEMLDELPNRESFEHVDRMMEGLGGLSPTRLNKLLRDCRSVKVKRLFLFFADRHRHAWLKRIDRSRIDLGKGKRLLVRGGKLDPTYGITVPAHLDAPV